MRTFGRTCRGKKKVYLTLVRQTEKQLLSVGQLVGPMALKAMLDLYEDCTVSEHKKTDFSANYNRRQVTMNALSASRGG